MNPSCRWAQHWQSSGSFPDCKDSVKITWSMGARVSLSSLRASGWILSGPAALIGFKVPSIFLIPFVEMVKSGMMGYFTISGVKHGGSICTTFSARCFRHWGVILLKTDLNCSLK